MRLSAAILAASLAALTASPARAEFDDAERAAIRDEVRAYLLENPEILREMVAILEERDRVAQEGADRELVAMHADRIFADGYSFVGGNPEGDVTLVEFLDYQCAFCRRAHPEVTALVEQDDGIRYVVKDMPILGPGSELAARAALATLIAEGPDAYARLHDVLMRLEGPVNDVSLDAALLEAGLEPTEVREGMEDAEVTRRLEETRALALELGIAGTPTFVLEDRMLRGYLPRAELEAVVAQVRGEPPE